MREIAAVGRHRVLGQVALAGRIGHERLEPRLRQWRRASAAEGGAIGGGVVAIAGIPHVSFRMEEWAVSSGFAAAGTQLAQPLLKTCAVSATIELLRCAVEPPNPVASPHTP